ncbi:MAG: hypothetical protein U5K75_02435 [Ahrensia sp.]|nr:hypothetical protein [Ahrensia sp.]
MSASLGAYKSIFDAMGPWLGGAIAAVGVFVVYQAVKAGLAHGAMITGRAKPYDVQIFGNGF